MYMHDGAALNEDCRAVGPRDSAIDSQARLRFPPLRRVERRRFRRAGQWRRCRPHLEGTCGPSRVAVDVDADVRLPRGPHADTRLRGDARGGYGGVRQELAAGMTKALDFSLVRRPTRSADDDPNGTPE